MAIIIINEAHHIGATRFAVGLSAIHKVQAGAFDLQRCLKRVTAGGGILEVVPIPQALFGASASGWGMGYALDKDDVISTYGEFYLACSGQTVSVAMVNGYAFGHTNE